MSKNGSYTYLLPLLSEQVNLKKTLLTFVKNTYIFTNKNKDIGKFYILCEFNYSDESFTTLEKYLIDNELFITSYENNSEILYEYEFPDVYIYEQKTFIEGKYSEFKQDTKDLILSFWSGLFGHIPSFVTGVLLKIRQILDKDPKLRTKLIKDLKVYIDKDAELGNKIELINETYSFKEKKEINLKNLKDVFE